MWSELGKNTHRIYGMIARDDNIILVFKNASQVWVWKKWNTFEGERGDECNIFEVVFSSI